jgi:hypothetical protein
LNQLKSKIVAEKELAKKYLVQGKRDWAALALQRSKIMQAELDATTA